MRRLAAGVCLLALAGLLTGCAAAVTPSRLGEYQARAEQITTELEAAIPDALGAERTAQESTAFFGEPLAYDPSRELAWWEVATTLELPDGTSAVGAAEAIDAYFAADDDEWAVEPAGEVGDGVTGVVYRLGDVDEVADDGTEWIVEVRYPTPASASGGRAEVDLRVQSPLTVRGDEVG